MNQAIVTGPWQHKYPYWVEVYDQDGKPVETVLVNGGMHFTKEEAKLQATEYNSQQQSDS